MKILNLTRYDNLGASSRVRSMQYFAELSSLNLSVIHQPLFDNEALSARYERNSYKLSSLIKNYIRRIIALCRRDHFDVLWIEKEALPWLPLWVEALLLSGTPYVLDYDDAVFHNYDLHRLRFVRFVLGRRLDGLMSKAALVVAGNQYIAQRARDAGAKWVEILPTVVNINRYSAVDVANSRHPSQLPAVVWIGSPSTVHYLNMLKAPLQALAQRVPFVLRVIGGEFSLLGVQVECVQWSEDTEVGSIAVGDVGVMPLLDSPWEQGKCGYKLIQYMACGLPVVASPVGVNAEIVEPGVNGYLASNDEEWLSALEMLLTQAHLRQSLGKAGRAKVEAQYCIQKTGPKMAELLKKAAKGR